MEEYALHRAGGASIPEAARRAGFGRDRAKQLELEPEVGKRIHELRGGNRTLTTVSPGWLLEASRANIEAAQALARDAAKRAAEAEEDAAPLFSAAAKAISVANDAIKFAYDAVNTGNGATLQSLGVGAPRSADRRVELRARLSGTSSAITVPGESVPEREPAETLQ